MTRRELIDLCLSYPGAYEDYPFDGIASSAADGGSWAVLRHRGNKKSFALVFERGGLCVNLKCEPMRADFLRGALPGVTPAYHMNKRSWITVRLNGDVPEKNVFDLIDASFESTLPKKRKIRKEREAKEWIIPSNPKYYDVIAAFKASDVIDWKQGRGIMTGDTVFLYVGAPVSAILYKCRVPETDLPYDYQDKNLTITALMKIKLLKQYEPDEFTFERLNDEFKIFAIRGPRGTTPSLSAALNDY